MSKFEIPEKHHKYFLEFNEELSDTQERAVEIGKFFEEYQVSFKKSLDIITNRLSVRILETIEKFEELVERNKNSKEDCIDTINDFAIQIVILSELFDAYMRTIAPFINMCHHWNEINVFQDVKYIYEETKKQSDNWLEFIIKILEKRPRKDRSIYRSDY